MINMCTEEAAKINMIINAKKCAVLRFGARYKNVCTNVNMLDTPLQFVTKAKYLGVMLQSYKRFDVDLHYMKTRFYKSFNSIFHRVGKVKNELVTQHLVSSYCKPHLLYATECLGLSATQMRSLQNAGQCATSHIFNVSGQNVNFVCSVVDNESLYVQIVNRRIKFLNNLAIYHGCHTVLNKLYSSVSAKMNDFCSLL